MWTGREATRRLKHDLLESDNSAFIDEYLSYRYLYEAHTDFVMKTGSLKATQSITTVADQKEYTLSSDHLYIYTENNGVPYIQYEDGSGQLYFPKEKAYQEVVHQSSVNSTAVPGSFAIIDHPTLNTALTGTTTAIGAATNGESTLTDAAATFTDTIAAGDMVYNETDSSYGVVITVTSDTALVTALFGGTNNQWASSDSYVVTPQGRLRLVLGQPPTTAGHTMTVYYVARPAPVFSPFRAYRTQSQFMPTIIRAAKALYEFRGGDYQKGSMDKQFSKEGILNAGLNYSKTFDRRGYSVNLRRNR